MAGLSPTQRTLRALRQRGLIAAIVEKFNSHIGPFGQRQDLFGIIDILALCPQTGVIGIQSCGQSFSEHRRKILEQRRQETIDWLSTPSTSFELWAWRRVKLHRGSKSIRWRPRVAQITLDLDGDNIIFTEVK